MLGEDLGSHLMMSYIIIEFANVISMTALCDLMRRSLVAQLGAQLKAEASHGAVCKILAVLCDAVAHLGPSGEVMKPSPSIASFALFPAPRVTCWRQTR